MVNKILQDLKNSLVLSFYDNFRGETGSPDKQGFLSILLCYGIHEFFLRLLFRSSTLEKPFWLLLCFAYGLLASCFLHTFCLQ